MPPPPPQPRQRQQQHQVRHQQHEERLVGHVVGADDVLGDEQQLGHRHRIDHRGFLHQEERVGRQCRQRDGQCLRQHHMPQHLGTLQPDGARRFHLSAGHRLQAGPQCLGHVAAAQEGESNHPAGKAIPVNADLGQPVVQEEKLDEQRRVARQFDVGARQPVEGTHPVAGDKRHGQAQQQRQAHAPGREPQRHQCRLDKARNDFLHVGPIHVADSRRMDMRKTMKQAIRS